MNNYVYLVYEGLSFSGEAPYLIAICASPEGAVKIAESFMKEEGSKGEWVKNPPPAREDYWHRGDEYVRIDKRVVLS